MGRLRSIPTGCFFFFSGPITTEVERAVMNGWVRSFHSDAPEGMNGLLDGSCLD